ncbi:MAG: hypothetical protein V7745_05185 [Pseudomonadales bacterium]
MDGTGKLFKPLLEIIPDNIAYEVFPLSSLVADNPKQQAKEIVTRLGVGEFVIFAESYSGIIAYELSKIPDINIKHILFAASFLSRPSQISRLGPYAPLFMLRKNLITKNILSRLFFGHSGHIDLVKLFLGTLDSITDATLKKRLRRISKLTLPATSIEVPCTYLQATKDKLVSKKAVLDFKKICVNLTIKQIKGGHFIAQSNPLECWDAIKEVITLYK